MSHLAPKRSMKLDYQGEVKVTKYGLNMKWVWRARLRETKRFWVDKNGTKYCKKTGWPQGATNPVFVLDVNTIVKLA